MENPEPINPTPPPENQMVYPNVALPTNALVKEPGTVTLSTAEYDELKRQAAAAQSSPLVQAATFVDPAVAKKNRTTKEIIGLIFAILFVLSIVVPGLAGLSVTILIIGAITIASFFTKPAKGKETSSPIMTTFKVLATIGIVVTIAPICFIMLLGIIFASSGSRGS